MDMLNSCKAVQMNSKWEEICHVEMIKFYTFEKEEKGKIHNFDYKMNPLYALSFEGVHSTSTSMRVQCYH